MSIIATNTSGPRVMIPPGMHFARCYEMIEIGTVQENIKGRATIMSKVRIGWELPQLMHVFKEGGKPEPMAIAKEFTISLSPKSNLRKMLAMWRGRDFTEAEAKRFDITVLIGMPCLMSIFHKPKESDPSVLNNEIGSITAAPTNQGALPAQFNPSRRLEYDNWNQAVFESLPDFIKNKMKTSLEYAKLVEQGKVAPIYAPQPQYQQPQFQQPNQFQQPQFQQPQPQQQPVWQQPAQAQPAPQPTNIYQAGYVDPEAWKPVANGAAAQPASQQPGQQFQPVDDLPF